MAVVLWNDVEALIDRALERACEIAADELGEVEVEFVLHPGWGGELRLVGIAEDEDEDALEDMDIGSDRVLVQWETDIDMLRALRAFV